MVPKQPHYVKLKTQILPSFFVLAFWMCYQFQLGSVSRLSVASSPLFASPDVSGASFSPGVFGTTLERTFGHAPLQA